MAQSIQIHLPLTGELRHFRLPSGVQRRLKRLLDRQDAGQTLTKAELQEAEGLVELAEMLALLGRRARGSHQMDLRAS